MTSSADFGTIRIAICRSAPKRRIQTAPPTPNTSLKRREEASMPECALCHQQPATSPQRLCPNCHWAVQAEIQVGLRQLEKLLARHARFEAWCVAHGVAA